MAGTNRITRSNCPRSVFEDATKVVDATVSFNQGDLMYIHSNLLAKQTSGTDDGTLFLGIAPVTVALGKLAYPYTTDVDASAALSPIPGPVYGVICKLVSKTADAWTPGCKVYPYATGGAYYVTSATAGQTAIGIYQGPTVASATAGSTVEVLIGETYTTGSMNI